MNNQAVNFFLVGAPRCGTTSLFNYLSEHPQIHTTTPKEPLHFCRDFEPYRVVRNREEYLKLMRCPDGKLAVGEGSTMYLLSDSALSEIRSFREDAKILLAVRNPIELFLSWHGWMVPALEEDESDPEVAWELQTDRLLGNRLPKTSRISYFVQYREICSLASHARKLLQVFPREQIHTIVFEDLIRDPKGTYESVLSFLGVPSDGRTEFPKVNERREWRSSLAANLYFAPPKVLKPAVEFIRQTWLRMPDSTRQPLRRLFFNQGGSKPELSDGFRQQLKDQFRSEVYDLEELLGLDLSCWGYGPKLQAAAAG